jgi:hypothetical protein
VLIFGVTLLVAVLISDLVTHSRTDVLVAHWFHEAAPGPGEHSSIPS